MAGDLDSLDGMRRANTAAKCGAGEEWGGIEASRNRAHAESATKWSWAGKQCKLAAMLLAVLAAFGSLLSPSFALAQDIPQVISPLKVADDPNGVNLVDGKIDMSGPKLSVPGAPHLTFDKIQNAAPYISGKAAPGYPDTNRNTSWSAILGEDRFRLPAQTMSAPVPLTTALSFSRAITAAR